MPQAPATPAAPWLEALDAALVARLRRPLDAAGIIPLSMVNRIVGWVQYFSGRLPLLGEVARRRGRAGDVREGDLLIVHARFSPPPAEGVAAAPVVVERVVVRAAPPPSSSAPGSRVAPAQLSAPVPDRGHESVPADETAPRRSAPQADLTSSQPTLLRSATSVFTAGGEEPGARGPTARPSEAPWSRDVLPRVLPRVREGGSTFEASLLAPPRTDAEPSIRSAASTPPRGVIGGGEPGDRGPTARSSEAPRSRDLLPRVRSTVREVHPIVREGGSPPEASPPAQLRTDAEPSIRSAVSTPPRVVEAFAERARSRSSPGISAMGTGTDEPTSSPLPRVTPVRLTASAAAPSPPPPLPHVRPRSARAASGADYRLGSGSAGAAYRLGSGSAFAAPEGAPWAASGAAPQAAALPHDGAGGEPVRRRRGAPEEQSIALPATALPAAAPVAAPIDVDALVDKVQRKLLRRLAAERERKGGLG
jgi:hypothetical protein